MIAPAIPEKSARSRFPMRFLRRQDGSASVEAVLWMPIFVALFGLMVDTSLIFFGQTKVLRVVQDGNRSRSIGLLNNTGETETYITNALAALSVNASVTSTETAGIIHTDVTFPAAQLQALGFFSALVGLQLTVSAEHMIESFGT